MNGWQNERHGEFDSCTEDELEGTYQTQSFKQVAKKSQLHHSINTRSHFVLVNVNHKNKQVCFFYLFAPSFIRALFLFLYFTLCVLSDSYGRLAIRTQKLLHGVGVTPGVSLCTQMGRGSC